MLFSKKRKLPHACDWVIQANWMHCCVQRPFRSLLTLIALFSQWFLSALWCPNKCRKLKLIAIFVFSDDSDCCSTAENKHFPLIKHPSRHEESVRFSFFTTRFFILPLFTDSCAIFAAGKRRRRRRRKKKGQTKQEMRGKHGKENSSKEVLCHCWDFFSPHFLWQSGTISCKGQWYWNKTGLFHSGPGTMEVTQSILLRLRALF